jgi:gliding motility-associated-like protein
MKRSILFLVLVNVFSSLAAQYSVNGGGGIPLLAENNTQNRLEVYLLNGLSGARIGFTSSNFGTHQWYRYKENGNAAVPVASVQNGNTSYITDIQDGCGYFVGSPTESLFSYVWIIDYSRYVPRFFSLHAEEDEDKCLFLKIIADVEAEPLFYYLPSGYPVSLLRTYHLKYNTQEWNEDAKRYLPKEEIIEKRGLISEEVIKAPLADTYFTLTGDQFAEHFGLQQTIQSDEYRAIAVKAHYTVETDKEHADNEIHHTGDVLGGSAPIEYTFTAYANEPVAALYIWKISELDSITNTMNAIVRYTNKVLRYNFERNGIYRVELEVIDRQSICIDTTQYFNVIIDNTVIKIPNAFSPGSSPGINDELKVAFSSIVAFKASVFNRWGNLLFQWDDPTKGWDGRVNGRFVPSGVYYVVVEYKDSTGRNRTASRAVNVLRARD